MCQRCFADICGDSLRITDVNNTKNDSDSGIDVKDILSVNKISNKGELTSALKRLDQLWDVQHLFDGGSELYQLADLIYDYEGKTWDSYFNEVDAVSDDFMAEREDIIEKKVASSIRVNSSVGDGLPEEKIELLETL